jgi:hypothetical protein
MNTAALRHISARPVVNNPLCPSRTTSVKQRPCTGPSKVVLLLPVQIIRAGRRIVWRILSYNRWLSHLFATFERIMALEPG